MSRKERQMFKEQEEARRWQEAKEKLHAEIMREGEAALASGLRESGNSPSSSSSTLKQRTDGTARPTFKPEDVPLEQGAPADARPHAHVVLLGPEGSGKTVLAGALLLASGYFDIRGLGKYKKETAFQTAEVRFHEGLTTPELRFTLFDVPGGRKMLPLAAQTVSKANVVVLVISAKGRELEAALGDRTGNVLREHLVLAKALGAQTLVVAVSKMEEVKWDETRFQTVRSLLSEVLDIVGFKSEDVFFAPVDGVVGDVRGERAPWHTGGALIQQILCSRSVVDDGGGNSDAAPPCILVHDVTNRRGDGVVTVSGHVECGRISPGLVCQMAPRQHPCVVQAVLVNNKAVSAAQTGEAVRLRLAGLPTNHIISEGSVLAGEGATVQGVSKFKSVIDILEMPDNIAIITAGLKGIMHARAAMTNFEITKVIEATTLSSGHVDTKPKGLKVGQRATVIIQLESEVVLEGCTRLGLIALRAGDLTLAVGHVAELAAT